jgi:flavin-binding protein dodecin
MYNMIEIVGVSSESFAKATESAVLSVAKHKEACWFEVVELRGGVRDGKIEFQVKVKIAVKAQE